MSVSRTLAILTILAVILGAWFFATSAASHAAGSSPSKQPSDSSEPVALLKSDAAGITIEVRVSGLALEQETVNGIVYDTVSAPGFGMSAKIGSPQIPTKRVLLGIPLGAEYHLHITADQPETAPDRYRLLPAPTPILEPASESELQLDLQASAPVATSWDYIEDERAYSTDALYPDAVAKVVNSGFIRDQRFIAVQVNPVQYYPGTGELVLHSQFTVEIDFTYPHGRELGASRSDASFEPVLRAGLLNYESAANWRGKPSGTTVPSVNLATETRDASSPALKIMVNEDGIYQVTAADLLALDFPVNDVLATAYKLSYRGREVPIRVLESEPGIFGSLWFYGEQARTKYTDTNVYWLTYDSAPGAEPGVRMPTISAPPDAIVDISPYYSTTVRLEEDKTYRSQLPWTQDSDHWFWDYTWYPDVKLTATAHTSSLAVVPYTAFLSASMTGYTSGEHCVQFSLIGDPAPLGSYEWSDGARKYEQLVRIPFDASRLNDGTNELLVEGCASDSTRDITFHDWFELDLRRNYQAENDTLTFKVPGTEWQYQLSGFTSNAIEVFDVSGTYTVSQLTGYSVTPSPPPYSVSFYDDAAKQGTRYLALTRDQIKSPLAVVEGKPSELRSWSTPPDYIIIAPEEFVADVEPLAVHRAAQGLEVQIADLESIFDEFNDGIYSPEAIRAFLKYEYDHWDQDPPSFVLLVGDGTYDYKGNLPDGNPNLLPPYMAWVDYTKGETAADNRYVTVNGDDLLPDMYIGRFPAETSAHVQAMVDKTIAYETNSAPRDWVERVLFVADDQWDYYYYSNDLVNNYLPEPYDPILAYYMNTCFSGDSCTQIILDTLNSTGALFVNYVGHGGEQLWTGYPEVIWDINDLSGLEPTTRLPVMLPMTCDEGSFHQAVRDTLAEETVRFAADRGAVASWSPTGEGYPDGHHDLNTGFLQAALYEGVRQIGAAAYAGKFKVFETGIYPDLIETYHIFGDPALRMNSIDVVDVAVGQSIAWSPQEDKIEITLSFTNTGPDLAVGVALTDVMPTELIDPAVIFASPEVLASREGITFAWTIDDLPSGASGKIVLEASTVPDEEVSFINVAQIGVQTHDLVPGNNVSWAGLNLESVYLPLIMKRY